MGRALVFWVICSQQLKPSLTMMALVLLRTAGRRTRSPSFCERSYLSFSKPKGPAMPQQPESRSSNVGSGGAEEGDLVVHAHGGAVMAVAVDDDLFVDAAGAGSGGRV